MRSILKSWRPALWAVVALVALGSMGCSTVPISGRRQFNMISNETINAMSFDEYSRFLGEHRLSNDVQQTGQVRQVGRRIQSAVEKFFASQNDAARLSGYQWEFNLVEDPAVNAWCMPGGKVVIYTGILPITRNAEGLAVVMGHEIAHAVADHGGERMSQGLVAELGGLALDQALQQQPDQTRAIFLSAYGLGAQLGVLLPYSRTFESEADHLGLVFMAMAGYDPHAAIDFWQRMTAENSSAAPPEFLSTHPSDESRIAKIRELIPEAMRYYRPGGE